MATHTKRVRRYRQLVQPYRPQRQSFHTFDLGISAPPRAAFRIPARLHSKVTDLTMLSKPEGPDPLRAIKTRSHPFCTGVSRTASRILRLSLFRTTALPMGFPTAKPVRLFSRSFRRATKTSRPSDHDRPERRTAAKSLVFLSLRSLFIGPAC